MYSVVVPCYNSSETLCKLVELFKEEMDKLKITEYEMVLVNDCSPDGGKTIRMIRELAKQYSWVKGLDLAKNTGQHNAVVAGLNYVQGDIIIGMDDDMQTHPSQLAVLLEELDKGYDIVHGYYPEKKHSLFRNFGSWVNYMSVRILIGKPKELKTSSYWVIKRFVRDSVIQYTGAYAYLQGLFLRSTTNITCVPIKHFEREVGQSNYTLKKLIKLWTNIIGFSIVPLRLAIYIGEFFLCVGIIGAIAILIKKLLNPGIVLGWASTMIAICFFAGLNLLFLGLIGEYIGRIFLNVNHSPQYVVREFIEEKKED